MFSKNFNQAFSESLEKEGGFVDDPNDSGGATKFGISLRTYIQYYPLATVDTIKNLTIDQARNFYHEKFWLPNKYDEIRLSDFSKKIFDACINMGAHQAHLCLQRALNCVGCNLVEDGILGSKTIEILNKTDQPYWCFAILCAYRSELAGYYRLLATIKPQNKKFLAGWLKKRAYS